VRRLIYYLGSLFTLRRGVHNWPVLFRLLRPGGQPVTLVLRDGTRYLARNLMDAWTIKETNLDRHYEVYGAPIQDGWTIIDIGAALGDFAVFAARRAPLGQVFDYEPAPDSLALLERNLRLNGVRNVLVQAVAVSREAGTVLLDTSGGVAVQYRTVGSSGASAATVRVPSKALSDVLSGLPGGVLIS
jgi:FkbM family methyltransferase